MNGKYLSDFFQLIDYGDGDYDLDIDTQLHYLNLIKTGCGSGKTSFVKNILSKAYKDILLLIDTRTGADQLKKEMYGFDITVMTYAEYALLVKNYPEDDRWEYGSCTIVCDEFHNLINFSKWDNNEIHKFAKELLFKRFFMNECTVIALSATPEVIFYEYKSLVHEIKIDGEIMHYETQLVDYYDNLYDILRQIKKGQKGIIYIPRITQIIKAEEYLRRQGIKTTAIWSKNNNQYWMTDDQLNVREYIIQNQHIPDWVDVLIINKSCETSINIYGQIDFMIIHSTINDTQEQARGRFRGDLKRLYLLDKEEPSEFKEVNLSNKWLYKKLYKEDKDGLCSELGIRDDRGRLVGWTTVKKILVDNGYIVSEKKNNNIRFSIIYQFDES